MKSSQVETPLTSSLCVSFNGDLLEVSAILLDTDAVDRLMKILEAIKALLPLMVYSK